MMDVRPLFRRFGVRYDDHWFSVPVGPHEKGTTDLILAPDPQDQRGQTSVGTVWAHVVQVSRSRRRNPMRM